MRNPFVSVPLSIINKEPTNGINTHAHTHTKDAILRPVSGCWRNEINFIFITRYIYFLDVNNIYFFHVYLSVLE
jgi:hypothetical protein